jgi:hypothetical protein
MTTPMSDHFDAVLVPKGYAAGEGYGKVQALQAEFGKLLGHPKPYVIPVPAHNAVLVAPTARTGYYGPIGTPIEGRERYDWGAMPGRDDVQVGILRDEAAPYTGDERAPEKEQAAVNLAESLPPRPPLSPEAQKAIFDRMKARGIVSAEKHAAMVADIGRPAGEPIDHV